MDNAGADLTSFTISADKFIKGERYKEVPEFIKNLFEDKLETVYGMLILVEQMRIKGYFDEL